MTSLFFLLTLLMAPSAHSAPDLKDALGKCNAISSSGEPGKLRKECAALIQSNDSMCNYAPESHVDFCKAVSSSTFQSQHILRGKYSVCGSLARGDDSLQHWCLALAKRRDSDCRSAYKDSMMVSSCQKVVDALQAYDFALAVDTPLPPITDAREAEEFGQTDDEVRASRASARERMEEGRSLGYADIEEMEAQYAKAMAVSVRGVHGGLPGKAISPVSSAFSAVSVFRIVPSVRAMTEQFVEDYDVIESGTSERERAEIIRLYTEIHTENKSRGYTAPNGRVVIVKTSEQAHDEVHEAVHLLSAPGGKSKIMTETDVNINEAFTEYFTRRFCAARGISYDKGASYPSEIRWGAPLIDDILGYNLASQMYFGGLGIMPAVDKVAQIWMDADEDDIPAAVGAKPDSLGAARVKVKADFFKWENRTRPEFRAFWNFVLGKSVF